MEGRGGEKPHEEPRSLPTRPVGAGRRQVLGGTSRGRPSPGAAPDGAAPSPSSPPFPPPPAIGVINLPRSGRGVIGEEKGCLRPPRQPPERLRGRREAGAGGDVGTHSPGAAPAPTVPECPGSPRPPHPRRRGPARVPPSSSRVLSSFPAGTGVPERLPSPRTPAHLPGCPCVPPGAEEEEEGQGESLWGGRRP